MEAEVFKIIQGANSPIVLTAADDISDSIDLHVVITHGDEEVKHWYKDDLMIAGTRIIIDISQSDSISMPAGPAHIEVRRTDANGTVHNYDHVPVVVIARDDRHLLNESEAT